MLLLVILIFIFGLATGSFLNCLVYRIYKHKTIQGRSFCPKCRHQLGFWDLIPVASFLYLKRKCGYCNKKISFQYPLGEFGTGLVFVLGFLFYKPLANLSFNSVSFWIIFLFYAVFSSILIIIFIYDFKYYLIPDKISVPALLIILGIQSAFYFLGAGSLAQNFLGYVFFLLLSGVIGAGFFAVQFFVSRGRWIGGGDIRLGALMGVMLGWPYILIALFLSYILGSAVCIPLVFLGKKKLNSKIPFGVFLTVGTLITLIWGKQIFSWYLGGW